MKPRLRDLAFTLFVVAYAATALIIFHFKK